ncbi:head-tail connector protein [Priestia aryabhattai]|uniref:head-tail connector protein n=1 Tax=Priestia aryabhattai TaxID=412384 RepID=UPI003CAFBF5D
MDLPVPVVDLEELKTYLRIDGSEDDIILTSFIAAADEYLLNAGVVLSQKNASRYKIATLVLVTKMYENRDASAVSDKSVQSLILQMR